MATFVHTAMGIDPKKWARLVAELVIYSYHYGTCCKHCGHLQESKVIELINHFPSELSDKEKNAIFYLAGRLLPEIGNIKIYLIKLEVDLNVDMESQIQFVMDKVLGELEDHLKSLN